MKTAKITGAGWARAKLIAVPRNGAEQGVAIRVANRPEAKWPAIPSRGPAPPRRGQRLRQGDLEQAPQVEAEEHHHHGEEGDEARLLELHPPAHRRPGRARRDGGQRQGPERGQDARRGRERAAHHLGAAVPGAAHQAEDLEREHRQHARHGVEDEPAEQGEQQRDGRGCRRRLRGAPGVGGRARSSGAAAGRRRGGLREQVAVLRRPPGPTVSSIPASLVTGGRHCESLQAW